MGSFPVLYLSYSPVIGYESVKLSLADSGLEGSSWLSAGEESRTDCPSGDGRNTAGSR